MEQSLFFDGYDDLLRVIVTAPIMYAVIILFVRLAGKRSTSQMNNFDWVVTVALGSLMASCILLKEVTIAEGILAMGVLMALQWALTKIVFHARPLERLVKAEPTLLVHEGRFLDDAMRRQRVTRDEILAAVRREGLAALDEVKWVVLETDANMSVISKTDGTEMLSELAGVSVPATSPRRPEGAGEASG